MHKMLFAVFAIVLLTVLPIVAVQGQTVPELFNYQGRLLDGSGDLIDGETVDLTFTFYGSTAAAAASMFKVVEQNVYLNHGIYNVLIGSGTKTSGTENSLAEVFQNNKVVWMGIEVDSDSEMTPRTRISSSPYALATDVQWLKDLDLDGDGHYKYISSKSPADDCDDNDAFTYLGAAENIDGRDNSCPGDAGYGIIDEYMAENFNDGNDVGWVQNLGGAFSVNNFEYFSNVPSIHAVSLYTGGWGGNMTYSGDVRVTSGAARAGLIFYAQDPNNYYLFMLDYPSSAVRFYYVSGGGFNQLNAIGYGLTLSTTYDVKVEVIGTAFTAYIDGSPALSTSHSAYAGGSVGVYSNIGPSYFDNLLLVP